jgi:23S rRNA (cytidine1920-2'-O)/16S rRNA (cytidine1409-2'-O)-methyltransferase
VRPARLLLKDPFAHRVVLQVQPDLLMLSHANLRTVKTRLDKLLLDRGLASSRERAHALILAGRVLVNEQKVEKAGSPVDEDAPIRLLGEDLRYVSRGGLKLEHALRNWNIDLQGRSCLDVGSSTGGFTDCMLQHGAACVTAIDTGYGQMDVRLRKDPRVRLLEKTNARYLSQQGLSAIVDKNVLITFMAMDVSFISATLVLPAVVRAIRENNHATDAANPVEAVVLVKPQFEVGRGRVGKGGIVRDRDTQQSAIDKVSMAVRELNGERTQVIESPILGAEGNREFLLYCKF